MSERSVEIEERLPKPFTTGDFLSTIENSGLTYAQIFEALEDYRRKWHIAQIPAYNQNQMRLGEV